MKSQLLLLGALVALGVGACTSVLGVTDVPSPGGDGDASGGSSGGSSGSSGGSSSGSSSGSQSCEITWAVPACETCFEANCTSACSACSGNSTCSAFFQCRAKCTTDACTDACAETLVKAGGEGVTLEEALLDDPSGCVYASCRSECTTASVLGDPCFVDADCTTMACVPETIGWCSQTCTSNSDCTPANTAGNTNYCLTNDIGGKTCFPGCPHGQSDCNAYKCMSNSSAPACTSEPTVGGTATSVCVCPD